MAVRADQTSLGFHVTTEKKAARYRQTGCILPPVRFFGTEEAARRWMRRTSRPLLVVFERPEPHYPLPDHKPSYWSPTPVREWEAKE